MNNLQLFRMYRRFTDREVANFRWLMNARGDEIIKFWDDWRKWEGLAKHTYTELERRLAPPPWAQPTLYIIPKEDFNR